MAKNSLNNKQFSATFRSLKHRKLIEMEIYTSRKQQEILMLIWRLHPKLLSHKFNK